MSRMEFALGAVLGVIVGAFVADLLFDRERNEGQ